MDVSSSLLNCKLCNKQFEVPIILPCFTTICKKHLRNHYLEHRHSKLVENLIEKIGIRSDKKMECPICNKNHVIPSEGFKSDLTMEALLKVKATKKHEMARNSLNQLKGIIKERKRLLRDPDFDVPSYFQRIRREIADKVDRDVKAIFEERDQMLEKLSQFEQECIQKEKQANDVLEAIMAQFKDWNVKIRLIQLEESVAEEIKANSDEKIRELEHEIRKSRKTLQQYKYYHFKPNQQKPQSIGLLYLNSNEALQNFLSHELATNLVDLIEMNNELELMYQGSVHGFQSSDFHSKCDGIGQTLTVVKSADSYVFGGYTDLAWESSGGFRNDPSAFIFSLLNKNEKPCVFKSRDNIYSIECNGTFGPIFGGSDLKIATNAHMSAVSSTNLGDSSFFINGFVGNSKEAKTFLAGSNFFQIEDIAVFKKIIN